jgi:hypothetical protein
MPDEKTKDGGKTEPRQEPDKKPGHETADVAFDDIIDAILDANPEAVREHQAIRKTRAKKPNRSSNKK